MSNRSRFPLGVLALLLSLQLTVLAGKEDKPKGAGCGHRPAAECDHSAQNRAADRAGFDREKFRILAKKDSSLKISSDGHAHYICAFPAHARPAPARTGLGAPATVPSSAAASAALVGVDNATYTNGTALPLDQTFMLHSRPGASRFIYLDFDGHNTTGTSWNTSSGVDPIVNRPYDIDGDPTTFSDAEKRDIQEVWLNVAEDFAPFDVDVTTEDPGSAAFGQGNSQRVVFDSAASVDSWLGFTPGGIAGLGSFGMLGVDKPCFVFTRGASSPLSAANTASHEVGHTLRLSHMGQLPGGTGSTTYLGSSYYNGHADWAPIMGGPSPVYVYTVSTWCKGDYALANNTTDEIAAISRFLPLVAPDHGVDVATATLVEAPSFTAGGTIGTRGDKAWYKVRIPAGYLTLTGKTVLPYPNLKLSLAIVGPDGTTVVRQEQGVDTMGVSFMQPIAAPGDYYVVVDGVGTGDPVTAYDDYASLGRYTLEATMAANQPPVASTAGSGPLVGINSLTANFVGTASTDSDGTIVSYLWDFGDGTTSTSATAQHLFPTIGTYTVRLTVTDELGATGTTTLTVKVSPPNQPPVASTAGSTPLVGASPLAVNFVGAGSRDSDGSIASYLWNFGDGTTSTSANPTKTYAIPGTYTARLTVTDDSGATGTSTVVVTVKLPAAAKVVSVSSMVMSWSALTRTTATAKCAVTVVDNIGRPMPRAVVVVDVAGLANSTLTLTTDARGRAVFSSPAIANSSKGKVTYSVRSVSLGGYNYLPAANVNSTSSLSR